MITISLCMIVKNEQDVLKRCLESVMSAVDEIIIVDTGSDDDTVRIAEEFTNNIFYYNWCDDFSAARNFAFSKAKMSHCMWLDADDVLTDNSRAELIKLKAELDSDIDFVMMPYTTAFDKAGNGIFTFYRERIIKNSGKYLWKGAIHEAIEISGKVVYADITVEHRKIKEGEKGRNLRIFQKLIDSGEKLSPRDEFYYGRELYYNGMPDKAREVLQNFIDSKNGWIKNRIEAHRVLSLVFQELGKYSEAQDILLKALGLGEMSAELLCDIGESFMKLGNYTTAAFWYEAALRQTPDTTGGGFVNPDCYDYIPYIQLCVCYDRLKKYDLAEIYNQKAGRIKPYQNEYILNKRYFANRKNSKE